MRRSSTLLAILVALPAFAQDAPPQGEQIKGTFANSKIFPGTTRSYTVYVPKQYDGKTPAALWVNQDGVQNNAPAVFDRLIHAKEMPVVIGVFVSPGVMKEAVPGALPRFNRSFEYDGLGDAYARHLIEELLPHVETLKTADGREVKLTRDPNLSAIAGSSSGAACAFTAAWERPDRFRRVFSTIGTYVGLRGANVYPTLIRKVEPKPIRVFLQDGSADNNSYGGDWWMANQEMERSLTFAGYEVNHEWGTEGHSGAHGARIFPEAVKWLWKDWDKGISAGAGSQQMKDVLLPGEGWKLVGEGYKFTEGPAANAKGEVFFTDVPNGKTFKIGLDLKVTEVNADNGKATGLAFGPDGTMYGVGAAIDPLVRYDADGKRTAVCDGLKGNDLVVLNNGTMYVTSPSGLPGAETNKLYFVSAKGEKKEVDSALMMPNGVTVSPDQTLLYVAETRSHWVYSYQIQPDGSLRNKQKYYHLHVSDAYEYSGADGMKTDRDGRLYVATRMGVQFCDQAGRVNGIIPTPNGKCANLAFGGEKFDVLIATCWDKVYARKVKVTGYNTFDKPHTPVKPRL